MKAPINHSGWKRVLLLIIPWLLSIVVFGILGRLVIGKLVAEANFDTLSSLEMLLLQFSDMLGTFLVLWLFMRYLDKEDFINLGFHTKNKFTEFSCGILIGFSIIAGAYVVLYFLGDIVFNNINIDITEIIISILLFALVAVVEESLCRGYVLKNLMISFNPYLALALSSILFTIIHAANPNVDVIGFVNIFLAGIFLGISYIYTKNLWFPIALHFSWNLFQTFFGFNVSGSATFSIIEFTIPKNNILNGGENGFEGSILCTIVMIIMIFIVNNYYKQLRLNSSLD